MIKRVSAFFLIFTLGISVVSGQSLYDLNKSIDIGLSSAGVIILGMGLFADSQVEPLSVEEINGLNMGEINGFDRSAASNWSPEMSKASDVLLVSTAVLPALLMASKPIRNDYRKIAVLYFETMSISLGANFLVKGLIRRPRPFVYHPGAPLSKKTEADAGKSFYSGHTTLAFASAVFMAKVFSDYHPESPWRKGIWASSLAGATAVGFLRYESGKHFPSDILTGAIAGSIAGYFIPQIHKNKTAAITFFRESSENIYYLHLCVNF